MMSEFVSTSWQALRRTMTQRSEERWLTLCTPRWLPIWQIFASRAVQQRIAGHGSWYCISLCTRWRGGDQRPKNSLSHWSF